MAYRDVVLADSPLVYLPLDGATADDARSDASGNGRTATVVGTPTFGEPAVINGGGESVRFINEHHLQYASAPWASVSSVTLEVWAVIPNLTGTYYAMWDRDFQGARAFQMRIWGAAGKLQFVFWTTSSGPHTVTGSTVLVAGESRHIVVTYDQATGVASIYLDGVLDGSASVGAGKPLATGPSSLLLGVSEGGTSSGGVQYYSFSGLLDEAAYYGTALSAERVAAHYAAGLEEPPPPPPAPSTTVSVWDGAAELAAAVSLWDGAAEAAAGSVEVYGAAAPSAAAGAVLPITDGVASGIGVKLRFVAPDGSDSTGDGTEGLPYATISRALSDMDGVSTDQHIVMRGGVYSMAEQRVSVGKPVEIRAYPGEVPIIDGSVAAGSMTPEGDLRFFSYTSLRAKRNNAEGVSLTSEDFYPPAISGGQLTALAAERGWANVWTDGTFTVPADQTAAGENTGNPGGKTFHKARVVTGIYPDQCWAGGQPLIQVQVKAKVAPGFFWVDRTTGTTADPEPAEATVMYVHADDAAKGIEVSVTPDDAQPYWMLVNTDDVTVRGLRVQRHSGHRAFHAIQTQTGISNFTLEDVEILDTSKTAIKLYGDATTASNVPLFDGAKLVSGTTLRRVSVVGTGWLGMSAQYTDDTLVTACRWENINRHSETDQSPKNGAIKGSKNHRFTIEHSLVKGCHDCHGLWFDQSNYDFVIASNEIRDVDGSPIFWEISHKILIVNNLLVKGNNSGINVRVSGGSGVRLVNNTIVGGAYPLYIIAELRGQQMGNGQWFSEQDFRYDNVGFQTTPLSGAGLSSDIDRARPGARFASYPNASAVGNLTPGMEFKGGADEVVNNVVVHTNSSNPASYYRPKTANGSVNVPANEVVPGLLDGNVYQSSNGLLAQVDAYSSGTAGNVFVQASLAGWQSALADAYYSYVTGKEAASLAGVYADTSTGEPLAALTAVQGTAAVAPSDAAVAAYVQGGNQHFGCFLYEGGAV